MEPAKQSSLILKEPGNNISGAIRRFRSLGVNMRGTSRCVVSRPL
jgi:hypothetical protein